MIVLIGGMGGCYSLDTFRVYVYGVVALGIILWHLRWWRQSHRILLWDFVSLAGLYTSYLILYGLIVLAVPMRTAVGWMERHRPPD